MATLASPIPMDSMEVFAAFKKFVVAYDMSANAEAALEYALELAAKQNAEIVLVHAEDRETGSYAEAVQQIRPKLEKRLKWIVESSRKHGIDVRYLVQAGSPAEALTQAVAELVPDVLFLGAYGNNRLDRKVLGSTAESLLRTLPCPVVTLGPKATKKNLQLNQPVKLICPVDFPEDVNDRLRIIARLAKAWDAEVELVYAVDVSHEYSRPHGATDIQFEFDLLVARLLQEGVGAQSTLLYGTPDSVISECAQAINADYIVFGLHKEGRVSSYFPENLVAKVVKNAPCAILTYAQIVQTHSRR